MPTTDTMTLEHLRDGLLGLARMVRKSDGWKGYVSFGWQEAPSDDDFSLALEQLAQVLPRE